MINKLLGYLAFGGLISLPLLVGLFVFKLAMTTALLVGVALNSKVALGMAAVGAGVVIGAYWRAIKANVTDKNIILPATDTEKLAHEINILSRAVNSLNQKLDSQSAKFDGLSRDVAKLANGRKPDKDKRRW